MKKDDDFNIDYVDMIEDKYGFKRVKSLKRDFCLDNKKKSCKCNIKKGKLPFGSCIDDSEFPIPF